MTSTSGESMQKRLDQPGDPYCNIVTHPATGVNLHKSIKKRNTTNSPSSVCEMAQKTTRLHKPPKLVDLSEQKKEGKNEKDLYIHNSSHGTDGLYVISGSDI